MAVLKQRGQQCGPALVGAAAALVLAAILPAAVAVPVSAATGGSPVGNAVLDYDPWPGIRKDVFAGRDIVEDETALTLDAPVRAEDAALVPITVRVPAAMAGKVRKLTLIVEKNPAPVAAAFTFGSGAGIGERTISTRVRVDMYTNIRAVIETEDGRLLMATRYVKAAGGCSAPALKDADEALAAIGKMQLRAFEPKTGASAVREAQVMIKHPNYSGMQMNQLTGLYIPAKYVEEIEVLRDGERVFKLEGGISLSEDPNIRFSYADGGRGLLEVTAKDTDGRVFTVRGGASGS